MKYLKVKLFGKLGVSYDSKSLPGLASTKVQELFCYLLLHRDRPHPRTRLASILWGDTCTTANSRKYLRNALWRLRSALPSSPGLQDLLVTDSEWVELRTVRHLQLDVARFENAYRISQKVESEAFTDRDVMSLEHAIDLYAGDLLANWTQDWCVSVRDRLYQHHLAMIDRLAEYHESRSNDDVVVRLAETLLESDPAHERTHRRLMRVYLRNGDRTNALRQFARCVDALKAELGITPGPKTMAVVEKICGEHPSPKIFLRRVVSQKTTVQPRAAAS